MRGEDIFFFGTDTGTGNSDTGTGNSGKVQEFLAGNSRDNFYFSELMSGSHFHFLNEMHRKKISLPVSVPKKTARYPVPAQILGTCSVQPQLTCEKLTHSSSEEFYSVDSHTIDIHSSRLRIVDPVMTIHVYMQNYEFPCFLGDTSASVEFLIKPAGVAQQDTTVQCHSVSVSQCSQSLLFSFHSGLDWDS